MVEAKLATDLLSLLYTLNLFFFVLWYFHRLYVLFFHFSLPFQAFPCFSQPCLIIERPEELPDADSSRGVLVPFWIPPS